MPGSVVSDYVLAAERFLSRLTDHPKLVGRPGAGSLDFNLTMNVVAAFMVYARCHEVAEGPRSMARVADWKWPYECLDNMSFPGDEPWAVLLRHALELRLRQAGFLPEEKSDG